MADRFHKDTRPADHRVFPIDHENQSHRFDAGRLGVCLGSAQVGPGRSDNLPATPPRRAAAVGVAAEVVAAAEAVVVAAAAGSTGANNLFFNPSPAKGEVSLSGFVVVTSGPISTGSFIPPDDTVVTANGVALMRDPALNGAFYRVDSAGPQPQVTNGQLTLSASSASTGVSRTLSSPARATKPSARPPARARAWAR